MYRFFCGLSCAVVFEPCFCANIYSDYRSYVENIYNDLRCSVAIRIDIVALQAFENTKKYYSIAKHNGRELWTFNLSDSSPMRLHFHTCPNAIRVEQIGTSPVSMVLRISHTYVFVCVAWERRTTTRSNDVVSMPLLSVRHITLSVGGVCFHNERVLIPRIAPNPWPYMPYAFFQFTQSSRARVCRFSESLISVSSRKGCPARCTVQSFCMNENRMWRERKNGEQDIPIQNRTGNHKRQRRIVCNLRGGCLCCRQNIDRGAHIEIHAIFLWIAVVCRHLARNCMNQLFNTIYACIGKYISHWWPMVFEGTIHQLKKKNTMIQLCVFTNRCSNR